MRFTESETPTPGQMEFIPRERQGEIWLVVRAFVLATLLVGLVMLTPASPEHKNIGAVVAIIIVAVLGFYIAYDKQRAIDVMMNAEFQNLLFSQVAGLGANFCLFARRDGTIVYADDGLRKIFRHFSYADSMALEGLFAEAGVARNDRERLMNALYSNTADRLVFPIPEENGEIKEYILTVEPLKRPGGFAVVRGREYRSERAGTQMMPEALRVVSGDKIDHLLNHSGIAQFIADPYGRLEYVTPALELMLGYHTGEMTAARLSVRHVLHQLNGVAVPDDYTLGDYHNVALLKRKSGALLEVMLDVTLMRDGENKIVAATGCMLPHHRPA